MIKAVGSRHRCYFSLLYAATPHKIGRTFQIGQKLGNGGEGEVFRVQDHPEFALKLYFKPQSKEQKIHEMISLCPNNLRRFAAVPLESLYNDNDRFVGFLMDFVDGVQFHEFISKSRHENFPNARWNFFVRVAKNLARAIDVLHQTGFTIGDLNESNIFVLKNATVRIIDFDSSQFQSSDGQQFLCEVGKVEYTPPELQDAARNILRTKNHDYFSLAVVIFQILFINRHPFVGIPSARFEISAKENIKNHRFAFGSDSKSRGLLPPPNIINLEEASSQIEENFRRAFLSDNERPTTKEWLRDLENLEKNLKKCDENNGHFYPVSISKCPWCRIEEESNFQAIHFDPLSFDTEFDLNAVWYAIRAIKPPSPPAPLPTKTDYEAKGWKKIKAELSNSVTLKIVFSFLLCAAHFVLLIFIPKTDADFVSVLGVISSLVVFGFVAVMMNSVNLFAFELKKEKKKLEQENKQLFADRQKIVATDFFNKTFQDAEKKKNEYQELGSFRALRLQELERQGKEHQETEFLTKFCISDASIPQIGYSRTLTLRAFGIETAADLSWHKIYSVRGFGTAYAASLMAWKQSKLNQFVFNPNRAVTDRDERELEREIYRRKVSLEKDLRKAKARLEGIAAEANASGIRRQELCERNLQSLIAVENKFTPKLNVLMSATTLVYLTISTVSAIAVAKNQHSALQNENKRVELMNLPTNTNVNGLNKSSGIVTPTPLNNSNSNLNLNSEESEAEKNYKQGISLTRKGQFAQAVAFYEKAILSNAAYAPAHHELGYALLRLGKYEDAITALNKAVVLKPKNADSYRNLGVAYEALKNLEKSCENFRKAKELSPNSIQTAIQLNKCVAD